MHQMRQRPLCPLIEADPIGIEEGDNHIFVYVNNNSTRYADENGLHAPPSLNIDKNINTNECSGLKKMIVYTVQMIVAQEHVYWHMISDTWDFWIGGTNKGPVSHKQQIEEKKKLIKKYNDNLEKLKSIYKANCQCDV